jgi:hypothetical protein
MSVIGERITGELAADLALAHDDDPVAEHGQFLDIRRDDHGADASIREITDRLMDLLPCADVDTTRGLVEEEHLDAGGEPAGDERLLLVAAGEPADGLVDVGRLDAQLPDELGCAAPALRSADERQPGNCAQRSKHSDVHVVRHRLLEYQSLGSALLRHQADSVANRFGDGSACELHAIQGERTGLELVRSEREAREFGSPGTDEATEPENLSGEHLQ